MVCETSEASEASDKWGKTASGEKKGKGKTIRDAIFRVFDLSFRERKSRESDLQIVLKEIQQNSKFGTMPSSCSDTSRESDLQILLKRNKTTYLVIKHINY